MWDGEIRRGEGVAWNERVWNGVNFELEEVEGVREKEGVREASWGDCVGSKGEGVNVPAAGSLLFPPPPKNKPEEGV